MAISFENPDSQKYKVEMKSELPQFAYYTRIGLVLEEPKCFKVLQIASFILKSMQSLASLHH